MLNATFQTTTHAKCILAGEHTVLRGGSALVLPVTSKMIKLSYHGTNKSVNVSSNSPYEEVFLTLFWGVLREALQRVNKKFNSVHGKFEIENNIEMGAGLGFSAALSIVITRWLIWEHWIKEKKLYDFAHCLEDTFHGKSSGVDVAGAIADHLVHFESSGNIYEIEPHWRPKLYLSFSGSSKITERTINKVNALSKTDPVLANQIDKEMKESVFMIEEALKQNEKQGLGMLISGIEHAKHCFELWGLITPSLQNHIDQLLNLGAIAVKPTGAGGGGYVLSLWDATPPSIGDIEFIAVKAL